LLEKLCKQAGGPGPTPLPTPLPSLTAPPAPTQALPSLPFNCHKAIKKVRHEIRRLKKIGLPPEIKKQVLDPLAKNVKKIEKKCKSLEETIKHPGQDQESRRQYPRSAGERDTRYPGCYRQRARRRSGADNHERAIAQRSRELLLRERTRLPGVGKLRKLALLLATACLTSSCALIGLSASCNGTTIIGQFKQVGDLVKNANVQASDVVIGSINDIKLAGSPSAGYHADVTMCLDPGEHVSANVRAVVRTTSLLGEKFVDLQEQAPGPPYLQQGDVLTLSQTGKSAELEDVFARLASILGTGDLEDLNRFTHSQAVILKGHVADLRTLLTQLDRFTGTLAQRRGQIASSIDHLDNVARSVLNNSPVLQRFLRSFAGSSSVLSAQRHALQTLLFSLDRFSSISLQLLNATEGGLNKQFTDLRPVLRTLVASSQNLESTLQTLAVFSTRWPLSMPGSYLQLDVCQALPNQYAQGTTCPQSIQNDNPHTGSGSTTYPSNGVQMILQQPLRGGS
nr:MCE family protein [Actinomycetota bacterium]